MEILKMNNKPLYKAIATALTARQNCINSQNTEWLNNWEDRLTECNNQLPSGSGIDSGCKINFTESSSNKIIIEFSYHASYHAMDENGFYCGWYDFTLTVHPDFTNTITMDIVPAWKYRKNSKNYGVSYDDFDIDCTLQYFYDLFYDCLMGEIE
jgi:hypothetical protein